MKKTTALKEQVQQPGTVDLTMPRVSCTKPAWYMARLLNKEMGTQLSNSQGHNATQENTQDASQTPITSVASK